MCEVFVATFEYKTLGSFGEAERDRVNTNLSFLFATYGNEVFVCLSSSIWSHLIFTFVV